MFKNFLLVLLAIVIILGSGSYLLYRNRQIIINKVVDYTLQSITGQNSSASSEQNKSWLDTLIASGSQGVKDAVIDAMAKQNSGSAAQTKTTGAQKHNLATMAEMFMNGTSNDANINQMAQLFASTLNQALTPQNAAEHDINARDNKGRTLLINVCRVDVTPRVVKMIIKYGADINAVDNNGRSALMYAAAINKNPEVIQLLLDSGIDASLQDTEGHTAYDYAADAEIKDLIGQYMN